MFEDIGGKIKGLAKVFCWLGIIASVITGIALMVTDEDLILAGLLSMVVGSFASWISTWLLYGFGEIIDKLYEIEANTHNDKKEKMSETNYSHKRVFIDPEKLNQEEIFLANAEEASRQNKILSEGGWKCSCGRVNERYVSSCTCGKSKSEVSGIDIGRISEVLPASNDDTSTSYVKVGNVIKCSTCGKLQPANRIVCWECGKKFSE